MIKKTLKKVSCFVFIIGLLITQINIVSAQGILLIDPDYVQEDNIYTFDADDSGGDITLQFGDTLGEYLKWDSADETFKFSDDLDLEGNELKNFRIDNLDVAPTCDGTTIGRAYYNTTDNNTYICNGTSWEQINGGGSGTISGMLAAVQARRTSNFTLTNQSQWYDIPLDSTDVESDDTVIEHNGTNTERIDIKADGLYRLTYHLDANNNTTTHGIQAKLRINNTSDIPGSFLESTNYQTEHSPLTATVLAELNNGDYITLQAQRLSVNTVIGEPLITVVKLDGVKGDKGDPGSVGTGTDSESWTIDQDNTGTDLNLVFGTTLNEYMQWNNTAQAFILSDDLLLNFNELKQFKVENSASALTCNSTYKGRIYHNTTDTFTYVCNGTIWKQIDAAGGSSSIFGTQYSYSESVAETSTNSTVFQQKLRLTTPSLPAGTYKISWFYNWRYDSASNDFMGRVQVDDTTTLLEHEQEPKDTGTDQVYVETGFRNVTLTSGVHNIDLDFSTSKSFGTSYIKNVRLEIYRIN